MGFFVLSNTVGDEARAETEFLRAKPQVQGDAPRCTACGEYIGMLSWLAPHNAELELWTPKFGDIAFGAGDQILVSERFLEAYRRAKLTGLSGFNHVNITKVVRKGTQRKGAQVQTPRYYCAYIPRSRAVVDHEASGLELAQPWTCAECRQGMMIRMRRVVLEPASWSGEDIFYARGLAGIRLASERFKEFFDSNNVNNGVLIPAEEFSFDHT